MTESHHIDTSQQSVLKELYALCVKQMDQIVLRASRSAASELYAQVGKIEDWLQNDYSLAINLLESNHEWLATRVSDKLLSQFKSELGSKAGQPSSGALSGVDVSQLSLVSKDEFEDWLNVNKAIKYLERELSIELIDLLRVFNALGDKEIKEGDVLIGPQKILSEIKPAIDGLEIPTTPQSLIYKAIAKSLLVDLRTFYGEVQALASKQKLKMVSAQAAKPRVAAVKTSRLQEADLNSVDKSPAEDAPENFEYDAELGLSETHAPGQLNTLGALARLNASLTSGARLRASKSKSVRTVGNVTTKALAGNQLLSLISSLQRDVPAPVEDRPGPSLRALIEKGLADRADLDAGLGQQESELIDVTDRFFKVIVEKLGVSGILQKWLEKLKLTILKIVLRDDDFFSDAKHPARQMLNKLARLASGEHGGNKRLEGLLDQYIDRLVADFDKDENAIDEIVARLNELLERQEQAYKRNSERIARSYEDRKNIAEARHLVVSDLRGLLDKQSVPLVLLELLDKAGWREHMAATIVRSGQRSDAYREVLNVPDQLMSWFGQDIEAIDRWALELEMELEAPSLYEMVERELEALAKPELSTVLKHLNDCLFNEAEPILVSINEYDWPFEKHEKDIEALQPYEGGNDLTHWHKRILSLKIGDWVEMVDDSGRARCLRLAWSGRESFRFVFVDSQGMKDEDISLDDLVVRFKESKASFIDSEQVPLVDQGLHQMVQSVYEELSSQASCDVLTGLLNRQAFERALKQSVASALANQSHAYMLYFDLDKFNVTNTNYGHLAGDAILRHVADIVRDNSPEGGFCGRLGGNEFGMILPDASQSGANEVADRIRASVAESSFVWEDRSIESTVSAGLVQIDLETDEYDSVMRKAILACDSAKSQGQNRVVEYHAQDKDQRKRDEMLLWIQRLDSSLDDLLALRCQEIRPTGANNADLSHWEILLGVQHEGQILPPAMLIEAAEHFGRMARVDKWVVHNVLEWMEENPSVVDKSSGFSINLSGNSLSDDKFLEFVMGELAATTVDPRKICFEITETAAINNLADASEFIRVLKLKGCTFSLDDFGSGLSSYAYIQKLPVDYIKIDGMFVRNLVENKNDQALVRSINELAHFMGIETVAEYVENTEILAVLQQIGVDHSQGYGIKKPVLLADLC